MWETDKKHENKEAHIDGIQVRPREKGQWARFSRGTGKRGWLTKGKA